VARIWHASGIIVRRCAFRRPAGRQLAVTATCDYGHRSGHKRTLNLMSPGAAAGIRVEARTAAQDSNPAERYPPMSGQPDDALEVLREVWSAQGQTSADLDAACGDTKSCKKMADVGFDGLADASADDGTGAGRDLRAAWRDQLRREGKLDPEAGSVRDLVLGPQQAR
jgi:hypothetical protein